MLKTETYLSPGNCEGPMAGLLQRRGHCTPPPLTLPHHHPPHPHSPLEEAGVGLLPQTPPLLQEAAVEEHLRLKGWTNNLRYKLFLGELGNFCLLMRDKWHMLDGEVKEKNVLVQKLGSIKFREGRITTDLTDLFFWKGNFTKAMYTLQRNMVKASVFSTTTFNKLYF